MDNIFLFTISFFVSINKGVLVYHNQLFKFIFVHFLPQILVSLTCMRPSNGTNLEFKQLDTPFLHGN